MSILFRSQQATFAVCLQIQEWLLWASTELTPLSDDKLAQVVPACIRCWRPGILILHAHSRAQ